MTINLATKTLSAINAMLEADQGAKYRQNLQKVIPHIGDAYRGEDEGFREHLGASQIGKACDRALWYGFRWAVKSKFEGRMLRLFNRGHLEEARFIALLLSIGVQVYQQDAQGKQFRISDCGGHFGGSGDGVGIGLPDLPINTPALLEFKTHGEKSFAKLVKDGVRKAKPEHYAQMQSYMRKMGLAVALYAAVNKNDDSLHLEIIHLDSIVADIYIQRAHTIVFSRKPPEKIHDSTGWHECKYCDQNTVCHLGAELAVNCRTCHWSEPKENGTWFCNSKDRQMELLFPVTNPNNEDFTLTKERQLQGCKHYLKF